MGDDNRPRAHGDGPSARRGIASGSHADRSVTGGNVLRLVAAALTSSGIPFMLTGSVAAAYHGAPRATMDIDIVIAASAAQLRRFVTEILSAGLYVSEDAALETHRSEGMFNVIDPLSGWKVDLIHRKDRPFSREEFARRIATILDQVPVAVATLEDVIVSKLEWAHLGGSLRQIEDVATLVRVRGGEFDRSYVQRRVAELGLEREWAAVEGAA